MPLDQSDAALMTMQFDERVGQSGAQPAVRNLPDTDDRILRCGSDDVVVKRVPLDVEHGTFVTGDEGRVDVDAAGLWEKRTMRSLVAG